MKIIIAGGLGFIGKHFLRSCAGHEVVNIDSITYAADTNVIPESNFIRADISKLTSLPEHDFLINFAAESHVDRSIYDASPFVVSNVYGVHNLLNLKPKRFIHISTDEVYGEIESGAADEGSPLYPSNPYAATKASADHMIISYNRAHGLDYNIIRPVNNYGLGQYPEKLIPRSLRFISKGRPAQVHGDGSYRRMWVNVNDTVKGIWAVIEKGLNREIYNIGGHEMSVLEMIELLCSHTGGEYAYTQNRTAQDSRYSVDDSKIRSLGWVPGYFDISHLIERHKDECSNLYGFGRRHGVIEQCY